MLIILKSRQIYNLLLALTTGIAMNFSGNERMKSIREKIESMKNIDPNTFISKEELEELKKKYRIPQRGILHSGASEGNRAENAAPSMKDEQRPPIAVKKTFAFDTSFYRNFHSKYEKEPSKNPVNQRNENPVEQDSSNKVNAEISENSKEATIQINPPTEPKGLIKLFAVNQTEEPPQKEKPVEVKPQENEIPAPKTSLFSSNQQPSKKQAVNIFQAQEKVQKQAEPTFNLFGNKPAAQNSLSNTPQPTSLFGNKTFNGPNIFSLNKPKEQEKKVEVFDTSRLQTASIFKPIVSNVAAKDEARAISTGQFAAFSKPQEKRSYSQQSQPRTIFSRSNEGTLDFNAAKPAQIEAKPLGGDFFKKKEQNQPEQKSLFSVPSSGNQQSLFGNNNSNSSLFSNDSTTNKGLFSLADKQQEKTAPNLSQNKGLFSSQSNNTPTFVSQSNPTSLFGNQATESKPTLTPSFSQPIQKPQIEQAPQTSLFASKPKPTASLFNNNTITEQKKQPIVSLFGGSQQQKPVKSLFDNKPESKPLFGQVQTKIDKQSLFDNKSQFLPAKPAISINENKTEAKPVQSLFNNQSQSQPIRSLFGQPVKTQPPVSTPVETPKPPLSLFSNNQPIFDKPPTAITSLFGAKPITSTNNLFQNAPVEPTPAPKAEPVIVAKEPPVQQISRKQSQKEEKKINTPTAIGPGGKTIELPPASNLFKSEKQNLFTSNSDLFKAPSNNIFQNATEKTSLFGNSSTPGESKPSGNLFTQPTSSTNLFATNSNTSSLFGNNSNNQLFPNTSAPKTGSLFGNLQSNLFSSQNTQARPAQGEQEGEGEQDDDGPIEAEDDANPNLSTGKYDYIQTKNHFKEQASKFREGQKETMDGVTISIQQFQNSQDRFLYVRMPNKCISFCGKFLKKITEVRVINNNKRNIEVKKILLCGENAGKVELAMVRIGFKEDSIGEKFLRQVSIAIEKEK